MAVAACRGFPALVVPGCSPITVADLRRTLVLFVPVCSPITGAIAMQDGYRKSKADQNICWHVVMHSTVCLPASGCTELQSRLSVEGPGKTSGTSGK